MRRQIPPMKAFLSSDLGSPGAAPLPCVVAGRPLRRGALARARRPPSASALAQLARPAAALRHPLDGDPPPAPMVNVPLHLRSPASLSAYTSLFTMSDTTTHNMPLASAKHEHKFYSRSKSAPMMGHKDEEGAISQTQWIEKKNNMTQALAH